MDGWEDPVEKAKQVESRNSAFRMTTNMKAAPNSQGTLFQGGNKAESARWPRGYSPSRMAEVKLGVSVSPRGPGADGTIQHAAKQAGAPVGPYGHPHWDPKSAEHSRHLVREPIARSTMPAEHMDSMWGGVTLQMNRDAFHGPFGAGKAHAYHRADDRAIVVNPHPLYDNGDHFADGKRMGPREAHQHADMVLMHEIGHHVDNSTSQIPHARSMMAPNGRGKAEAYADKHMIDTYRPDPRDRAHQIDVHSMTYGQRGAALPEGYQDPSMHAHVSRQIPTVPLRPSERERARVPLLQRGADTGQLPGQMQLMTTHHRMQKAVGMSDYGMDSKHEDHKWIDHGGRPL